MTSKYQCDNCSYATFTRGRNFLNGGVLCNGEEILPDGVATIKQKGCASHSSLNIVNNVAVSKIATNEPYNKVIEQLTQLKDAYATAEMGDNISTRLSERYGICRVAMTDAIKLINSLRSENNGN